MTLAFVLWYYFYLFFPPNAPHPFLSIPSSVPTISTARVQVPSLRQGGEGAVRGRRGKGGEEEAGVSQSTSLLCLQTYLPACGPFLPSLVLVVAGVAACHRLWTRQGEERAKADEVKGR